jgi:hypothetical protein
MQRHGHKAIRHFRRGFDMLGQYLAEQARILVLGMEFQRCYQVSHGALMRERRISPVIGGRPPLAAAAWHLSRYFERFGAAVTARIVSEQVGIAGMAEVARGKPWVSAQDAGRRKQVILYNIDPVVIYFHLERLTSSMVVFLIINTVAGD